MNATDVKYLSKSAVPVEETFQLRQKCISIRSQKIIENIQLLHECKKRSRRTFTSSYC